MNPEIKITPVFEHSVCLELLPEKATILDTGCRGFQFTNFFKKVNCQIISCDIDVLPDAHWTTISRERRMESDTHSFASERELKSYPHYYKIALSYKGGYCDVVHTEDEQAKYIVSGTRLTKFTPDELKSIFGIQKWDLIKLDIEGEEYGILTNCKHPIAKQISVEFHEHTAAGIGKENLDNLLSELQNHYYIYNQVWQTRHGAGFNYWDVLLIAK